MMTRRSNLKLAYDAAGEEQAKRQLCLVNKEAENLPRYVTMSPKEYSAWQLEEQRKELAKNLKNAAAPVTDEGTPQQHQPAVRYSNEHRSQAAMQEKGGSIFSSAYTRFHFC